MEEKKLTDDEIIKELINESNRGEWCELNFIDCVEVSVLKNAIDLIYRLQNENKRLTEELKNLDWYKMWHKQFKKEIDDLTLELETYRPTKLSGNGQCKCSICGVVSWTDWFSRYKGQIICDECVKELLEKKNI